VSVVANKDCSSEPAQVINVTVHPLPVPVITQSGNILSAIPGYASYQWYDVAGAIAGANGQSYTTVTAGQYYVIVTDTNGCSGQSNTIPVNVLSTVKEHLLQLYPEPNNGEFILNVSGIFNSRDAVLEIMDMMGRVIYTDRPQLTNGHFRKTIDMRNNSSGRYMVRLSIGQYSETLLFSKY
jgi:hypothetical protein